MKTFYIFLISLSAFYQANSQNWTILNSGTASALSSVCFPATDTGYASGEGGIIIKTTNGGINWININPVYTMWYYTIHFIDSKTGWVAGENGILFKTIDGGATWDATILSPWFYKITSIYFPTPDTGYLVAANNPLGGGVIEKTTNGNYFLPNINDYTTTWLESVFFPVANTGYAVGDSGTIIKTTDGGLNWLAQTSGTFEHLFSVYFNDINTGYAVGDSGLILFTSDGGNNWVKQVSGTLNGLKSVYFINSALGFIVGNKGTILGTNDGGLDWLMEPSGTINNLYSVCFTAMNLGYATGDSGIILKTTNGGSVGIPENSSASKPLKINPNPAHDEITIETASITSDTYITISNVNGLELSRQKIMDKRTQMDIRSLPSGVYLIRLQNENKVEVGKLIKE